MPHLFRLNDGRTVGTGLLPDDRPNTFRTWADYCPVLTLEMIGALLEVTTPSRVLFDDSWIRNQGQRGSCNGYAGASALSRCRALRGQTPVILSGEFLYASINGGRDVGSMLADGMKSLMENGTCPEDLVPHEEYRFDRISEEAKKAAGNFKALECYRVDTEQELASGLALGFIGVVAVHVGRNFLPDANGIVYESQGVGNHAVCVDGLRIVGGECQFDMPNSWGTSWGDNGRGFLTWRRHLASTSSRHAFYLIRSATDDPDSDNPPAPAP